MVQKIISIGQLSINLVYLLIIPVIRQIRSHSLKYLEIEDKRKLHPFMMICQMFFAMMLPGSLELLSKHQQQPDETGDNSEELGILDVQIVKITWLQKKVHKDKDKKVIYLVLFGLSLLDFFSTLTEFILTHSIEDRFAIKFQLKPIQLIFTCFLCHIFLNYKLHRHHYLPVASIFIGVVLISYTSNSLQSPYFYIFMITCAFFPISIMHVIEKHLIEIKFFSIYMLLFFIGLFGFVFSLITVAVVSSIKCPNVLKYCISRNVEDPALFFEMTGAEIAFIFVVDLLCLSGINLSNFIINKNYSPTHVVICDVIVSIVDWVISLITEVKKEKKIKAIALQSISYCLLLISCLIYNQIIIIHLCHLDEYTDERIRIRCRKEYLSCITDPLITNANQEEGQNTSRKEDGNDFNSEEGEKEEKQIIGEAEQKNDESIDVDLNGCLEEIYPS